MSELEQETSTYLKDVLIGEHVAAFVTGTVLGFTIAYGLLKFCPPADTHTPRKRKLEELIDLNDGFCAKKPRKSYTLE